MRAGGTSASPLVCAGVLTVFLLVTPVYSMRRFPLAVLLLGLCVPALAQDKAAYDLPTPRITPPGVAAKLSHPPRSRSLQNDKVALTLLADGYFTLGTTGGLTDSPLDDDAPLTFGHPYALTSYPSFSVDGVWHHPEAYFFSGTRHLDTLGDTLRVTFGGGAAVSARFDLIREDAAVQMAFTVTNTDGSPHDVGLGLLFDAALGPWGDGTAQVGGNTITTPTTLQAITAVDLWERGTAPSGLGLRLDLGATPPDEAAFGNWFDLHTGTLPIVDALYDLALHFSWGATSLAPGASRTFTVTADLLAPDFPDGLFLRTDLPSFYALENNLLFPRDRTAVVTLHNAGGVTLENITLDLTASETIKPVVPEVTYRLEADSTTFGSVGLFVPELFENQVVTLTLSALASGVEVDRVQRTVLIPAVPFSDVGLTVTIDSVITANQPQLGVLFQANVEETAHPLLRLRTENIFLFEDGTRMRDFSLEKDKSNGADQADIVFVLDVTGSMTNEIGSVKDNIIEFTDSLSFRGVDYRLGMVTFLDIIENTYDFTDDVQLFQTYVAQQFAHGGGDRPENSLEALQAATQFNFRPSANRVVIWITDADYHINNTNTSLTIQDVINSMLGQGIVVQSIGDPLFQTTYYNPIVDATGGSFYDINGNFRDILLEISRLEGSTRYLLTYTSAASSGRPQTIELEVHYAGLGGRGSIDLGAGKLLTHAEAVPGRPTLDVQGYPNPFQGSAHLRLRNTQGYGGHVEIINVLGQRVRRLPFGAGQDDVHLIWEATDDSGAPLGGGLYLARVHLYTPDGGFTAPALPLLHVK